MHFDQTSSAEQEQPYISNIYYYINNILEGKVSIRSSIRIDFFNLILADMRILIFQRLKLSCSNE